MTETTVAQQVVEALRLSGIDTLYCLPGVQNDDFFDALVDARDIRTVVARHEQGAAYMAMGAAQVTGKPSACCVVPGPGLLNASGALTSAYWAYARVLAVVGQIATFQQGRGLGVLHELPDQSAVLAQVTKASELINDPAHANAQIQSILDQLHSGVPRPVGLEVPVNVWGKPTDGPVEPATISTPHPTSADIEAAAALIEQAKNPLIVVGSGAYGAPDEVRALAERLQIPVTTRRMGLGVLPHDHPLWLPLPATYPMWPEVDVVIGIGSRVEWPLNLWGTDDNLTLVSINIDPEEVARHPELAGVGLCGDAAAVCTDLLAAIGPGERPSASAKVDQLRQSFLDATAHLVPQKEYTAAINAATPDNTVIVEDVTQIGFASHMFLHRTEPRTFLSSGAAGTLGAGTAVAIGAADATDRPVVCITGDGGFLFTATELATAVQHDIPVNIVLFNDGAYGNVKRIQQTRFGPDRTIASTLQNPDFAKMADAFGVRYWHADSPTGLEQALPDAIAHRGPTLIEVTVGEMPNPWPFFVPGRNRGGNTS